MHSSLLQRLPVHGCTTARSMLGVQMQGRLTVAAAMTAAVWYFSLSGSPTCGRVWLYCRGFLAAGPIDLTYRG
jgi:hypothetical protein